MRRMKRRTAAWASLLGLFLAQLTMLAHACPLIEAAIAPASVQTVAPCEGMGHGPPPDRPLLCADHCDYGSHATNTVSVDQPAQVSLAFLVIEAAAPAPASPLHVVSLLARATAPPLFASSGRLRI